MYPRWRSDILHKGTKGYGISPKDIFLSNTVCFIIGHFHFEGDEATVPSSPASLKIFKFTDTSQKTGDKGPDAFLQIGDWVYPLIPGKSPALHAVYGAYVFPAAVSGKG